MVLGATVAQPYYHPLFWRGGEKMTGTDDTYCQRAERVTLVHYRTFSTRTELSELELQTWSFIEVVFERWLKLLLSLRDTTRWLITVKGKKEKGKRPPSSSSQGRRLGWGGLAQYVCACFSGEGLDMVALTCSVAISGTPSVEEEHGGGSQSGKQWLVKGLPSP